MVGKKRADRNPVAGVKSDDLTPPEDADDSAPAVGDLSLHAERSSSEPSDTSSDEAGSNEHKSPPAATDDFIKRVREILAARNSPPAVNLSNDAIGSSRSLLDSVSQKSPRFAGGGALVGMTSSAGQVDAFKAKLAELRAQISEKVKELDEARTSEVEKAEKIEELAALVAEFQQKEDFGFLLSRVNDQAKRKLLDEPEFRQILLDDQDCKAFVVSIDIRRSTELMLKARAPHLFAGFISLLCARLFESVVTNFGVFDKFTGDGILAFFPVRFSGEDSCYYAIKCARECHQIFDDAYRLSRGSFSTVLKDVGLGIGIDFGEVRLLKVAHGLTVVGVPVVYACRLSGAPAGTTLLNQPAFEQAEQLFCGYLRFDEVALKVKHEGEVLAYRVDTNHVQYSPKPPSWSDQSG